MSLLFDFIFEVIGYTVARIVLPLMSFGRIQIEPVGAPKREFNVVGYRHTEDGRIEIEASAAGLVGAVIIVAAALMGLLIGLAA
jgi:hypothetical protein